MPELEILEFDKERGLVTVAAPYAMPRDTREPFGWTLKIEGVAYRVVTNSKEPRDTPIAVGERIRLTVRPVSED